MADATMRRLIQLLSADDAELRSAAVLVAGAIGSSTETKLVQALLSLTESAEAADRIGAVTALGRLRADRALPRLIELVRSGGPELEAAAEAAGNLGARAARAIEKLMNEASPGQRRRIASALAHSRSQGAATATVHALLDEDAGVVDAAARSLAADLPSLTAAQRRTLADQLVAALQPKSRQRLRPASEAAMLRVLTALHDPRTEKILWSRLKSNRPASVRAAALQALGGLERPRTAAHLDVLFECARDRDFQVAAPALLLLQRTPVTRRTVAAWRRLLDAPDVSARRLAVEKLAPFVDERLAPVFVAQLKQADANLRRKVEETLSASEAGRRALFDALLAAESPDDAWTLVHAQKHSTDKWPSAWKRQLFTKACKLHERSDRRAEPMFYLLRHADAAWTRDTMEKRAIALQKKRDFATALSYLRLLARDPACPAETRFQLAVTGLRLSPKDTAAEARQSDPCLIQFGRLVQEAEFDLISALAKIKWLEAADLYYLGFHFVEQNRREQEFGQQVLEMLIRRSPRSALARDARRKLKREGLA